MKKRIGILLKQVLMGIFCAILLIGIVPALPGSAAAAITLPEGHDYATQVLGDPWDMNSYSDVSQYMNTSGQSITLQNIQVANGVFSAKSVTNQPNFAALFPGYETAMLLGKVGHNYPIQSSVYKCLYIAKISSGPANDAMPIYWFQDERLNGGVYGVKIINGGNTQPNRWNLVKQNLSESVTAQTPWSDSATWQGLRIGPSAYANVNFSIDWVRLTDCQPVVFTVPGLNGKAADVFLTKNGHEIYIGAVNSSNGSVDVEGVEAGTYTFAAKSASGSVVSSGNLTINQAPIATFSRPSMTSGKEYAASSGTSWDMSNPSAVKKVECLTTSFSNGLFTFTTPYPVCLDGAPDRKDPKTFLNTPQSASTSEYRYFSMKFAGEGAWQNVPDQMIVRLIWGIKGTSPGTTCWLVSQDIPTDVVWRTYNIDLYDAFNGSIEETTTSCPPNVKTWKNSGSVTAFRLDPNENQLLIPLTQSIEWLHLNAMDRVSRGTTFPVSINLNKPANSIRSYAFYYTTKLSAPTQSPAAEAVVNSVSSPIVRGAHNVFLPSITASGSSSTNGSPDLVFNWDTTRVTPGQYYLCVAMNDGLNTNSFCSEAPVQVQ